jgi:hypothetical protein
MANYRTVPTYTHALTEKGNISQPWYRLVQGLHQGTPPAAEGPITVTGSSFAWPAPVAGFVILTGGSVSSVTLTRTKVTNTGQTSGIFPVSQGDILTINSVSAPSMTFIPR